MTPAAKPRPGRRRRSGLPSPRALELADQLANRARRHPIPIRRSFFRLPESATPDAVTPLCSLLRGGQGGEVRIKLYVCLLWASVAPPHRTFFPARAWAELFDLPDPQTLGARRVNDAIKALEERRLIRVEHQRGDLQNIFLLLEDGSGRDYRRPASTRGERLGIEDYYIGLHPELITNGWLSVLSGRATSALIILRANQAVEDVRNEPDEELPEDISGARYLSTPERARYGLSKDTWTRATRELKQSGLVKTERQAIAGDFQYPRPRFRTAYRMVWSRLGESPSQ